MTMTDEKIPSTGSGERKISYCFVARSDPPIPLEAFSLEDHACNTLIGQISSNLEHLALISKEMDYLSREKINVYHFESI